MTPTLRSPFALLTCAWTHYKAHPTLFLSIAAFPMLMIVATIGFTAIADVVIGEQAAVALAVLGAVVTIVFLFLSNFALTLAISDPARYPTWQSAYRGARGYGWTLLFVTLLMVGAVLVGFLLFLIPAVLFAVWVMFSQMEVLFNNKQGVAALKSSRELVRGRFLHTLGATVVIIIVSVLFGIVFGIFVYPFMGSETAGDILNNALSVLINPLLAAYMYELYMDLKKTAVPQPEAAAPVHIA